MTPAEAKAVPVDVCLHFYHRLYEFEKEHPPTTFPTKGDWMRALWLYLEQKDRDLKAPLAPGEWKSGK